MEIGVIQFEKLLKMAINLPVNPNGVGYTVAFDPYHDNESGKGTAIIIKNDGVSFQWIPGEKVWEYNGRVRIKGTAGNYNVYCIKCNSYQDHILNKESTKIKCKKCQQVTSLKL